MVEMQVPTSKFTEHIIHLWSLELWHVQCRSG